MRSFSIMIIIGTAFLVNALVCPAEAGKDRPSLEAVKQETRDLLEALKGYSAQQREEAVRQARAALDDLDRRIEDLETRIEKNREKMDRSARQQARETLKSLRQQRVRLAEWYGSLKSSSGDAWGHMKEGFADAYRDINDAWEKARKEYGAE
ncbi:MAG: hypothetical protein SWH68_12420 [Thermodesulfobacteriota bacterium]|nr:hypothetical protein [Thermodesulfobacteriota bacterium]